jgi:hypothetical protein
MAVMRKLAQTRPVFHSEADFQHALAWELHAAVPGAQVRLEYRVPGVERVYVDIWLQTADGPTAIELKYMTRRLSVAIAGESFDLSQHSAHPPRRYDVVKDVARLERVVTATPRAGATAILLTNDEAYWTPPRPGQQIDAAFRVHEGRLLQGTLAWTAAAGAGTIVGRTEPLALRGTYRAHWEDYSEVAREAGRFRYLRLNVPSE